MLTVTKVVTRDGGQWEHNQPIPGDETKIEPILDQHNNPVIGQDGKPMQRLVTQASTRIIRMYEVDAGVMVFVEGLPNSAMAGNGLRMFLNTMNIVVSIAGGPMSEVIEDMRQLEADMLDDGDDDDDDDGEPEVVTGQTTPAPAPALNGGPPGTVPSPGGAS